MAVEEKVDRLIPFPVELLISGRVPPIFVKYSVVKLCNFSEGIGNELKGEEKHDEDDDGAWKHHSEEEFNEADFISLLDGGEDVLSIDNVTD